MKIIIRLIACPFVWAVIFISYTYHSFRNTYFFIRHGGEWITYAEGDKVVIQQIYMELKASAKNNIKPMK